MLRFNSSGEILIPIWINSNQPRGLVNFGTLPSVWAISMARIKRWGFLASIFFARVGSNFFNFLNNSVVDNVESRALNILFGLTFGKTKLSTIA